MSLILGINLPTHLFLVADTRLTKVNGTKKEYQDNFWKAWSFNERIHVVAAGDAKLAAYILRQLRDSQIAKQDIEHLRVNIQTGLLSIIDSYMKEGGKFQKAVLIFAGFSNTEKKKINASHFGDFQSKRLLESPGVNFHQSINQKVMDAIIREASRGPGISKDTMVEIDAPDSSILSIEINLPEKPIVKDIACFNMVLYAQKGLTEAAIPFDVLQELETVPSSDIQGIDKINRCSGVLAALVDRYINDHGLDAVGGDVVTFFVTPHGAVVPTALIEKLDKSTGKIVRISDIVVKDGFWCTRDIAGGITPYEQLMDFSGEGKYEI